MKARARVLTVIMAASLVLMSACGKKNEGVPEQSGPFISQETVQAGDAESGPTIYSLQKLDMEEALKSWSNLPIRNALQVNNALYLITGGVLGNAQGEQVEILEVALDGRGSSLIRLQDSATTLGSDAGEKTEVIKSFRNFQVNGKGQILGIEAVLIRDYSNPESVIEEEKYAVCAWDEKGELLWETLISGADGQRVWGKIASLICLDDGTAVIMILGDEIGKFIVKADGSLSEMQDMGDYSGAFLYTEKVTPQGGNCVGISFYDREWSNRYMVQYDVANDTVGKEILIPAQAEDSVARNQMIDGQGNLLYSNGQGIFCYSVDKGNSIQLMDFIDSDMTLSELVSMVPLGNDKYAGFFYEDASTADAVSQIGKLSAGVFAPVATKDIPSRQTLILACVNADYELKNRIVNFNKNQQSYRIRLCDYSEGGNSQLKAELDASKVPDILVADSMQIPMEKYAAKGLFADIDALSATDAEVSGEKFLKNVMDAYRVNGKLYEVIPSFYIRTYVGKKSLFDGQKQWTMQNVKEMSESLPEDGSVFNGMTNNRFMRETLLYDGRVFLDEVNGTSDFNNQEFASFVQYANSLDSNFERSREWWENYSLAFQEDNLLLYDCSLGDFRNISYLTDVVFGEEICFVGFPSTKGTGVSVISTDRTYAISAQSDQKDVAWEFIRYYLTDEYQQTVCNAFPVSEKVLAQKADEATKKPSYIDANGNVVEYEMSQTVNGEEIIYGTLTKKQADEAVAFIKSVKTRSFCDPQVDKIVSEEMQTVYDKTHKASEAVNIMQTRIQKYLDGK